MDSKHIKVDKNQQTEFFSKKYQPSSFSVCFSLHFVQFSLIMPERLTIYAQK